jgi:Uncharacterised protein conserved in bacteria (DUF2336)
MTAAQSTGLIAEIEGAVKGGSSQRRVKMLRQVTELFLSDADRLNEDLIGVFDEVLLRLIERTESRTLAELSAELAETLTAPRGVVRKLAHHDDAQVATPVLSKSRRLSDADLIEIANTRGQHHLLAVSSRDTLNAALTDALLKRGNARVSLALATNAGAKFSEQGYSALVESAEKDGDLAQRLGLRLDIPAETLRELLSKATATMRAKLLKAAPPEARDRIQQAIDVVASKAGVAVPSATPAAAAAKPADKPAAKPIDYKASETMVMAMNRAGRLGDQSINRFAVQGEYIHIVAALSLLASVKIDVIEPLIGVNHADGLMVACKASRLNWSTTVMVLRNRPNCPPLSKVELEQGKQTFESLSLSAAQRTIKFWSSANPSSAGN